MKEKQDSKNFELVLCVKDAQGNPTGQRKVLRSDDAGAISDFYLKYQGKPRRNKRRTSAAKSELPKGKAADKLAREASKYAEKQQAKKTT